MKRRTLSPATVPGSCSNVRRSDAQAANAICRKPPIAVARIVSEFYPPCPPAALPTPARFRSHRVVFRVGAKIGHHSLITPFAGLVAVPPPHLLRSPSNKSASFVLAQPACARVLCLPVWVASAFRPPRGLIFNTHNLDPVYALVFAISQGKLPKDRRTLIRRIIFARDIQFATSNPPFLNERRKTVFYDFRS